MRAVVLSTIRFYQRWISPVTPPRCRFEPSCSFYTAHAVERFGVMSGSWLGLRRVLRCHPWQEAGYDPCPEVSGSPLQSQPRSCISEADQ